MEELKAKQKACEEILVAQSLEQLQFEVRQLTQMRPSERQLEHVEKAVKLAHQVRSLIGVP